MTMILRFPMMSMTSTVSVSSPVPVSTSMPVPSTMTVSTTMSVPVSMGVGVGMVPRNIVVIQPSVFEERRNDGVTHSLHFLLLVLILVLVGELVLSYPLDSLVAL